MRPVERHLVHLVVDLHDPEGDVEEQARLLAVRQGVRAAGVEVGLDAELETEIIVSPVPQRVGHRGCMQRCGRGCLKYTIIGHTFLPSFLDKDTNLFICNIC